ncbi:hypothetical protein BDV18DRAFT_135791 [Aspergillus unguis]
MSIWWLQQSAGQPALLQARWLQVPTASHNSACMQASPSPLFTDETWTLSSYEQKL